ncbi:hypothetical protein GCM10009759_42490 [Kitasatospora saccharophila]|uniref:Uncharacterized protein n=1 Tax=Kitasatospora saccharophila TaxID=407973 RepID=A0ABN2X669_9ACTN
MIHDLLPGVLASALATLTGRPVTDVDVAGPDDHDTRRWDAPVLCTHDHRYGDVTWSLEIHDPDPGRSEVSFAAGLAELLGRPVLFSALDVRPSAYWLAAPNGLITRARLTEPDEAAEDADLPGGSISAVRDFVPQLPHLRLDPIAEGRYADPFTEAADRPPGR